MKDGSPPNVSIPVKGLKDYTEIKGSHGTYPPPSPPPQLLAQIPVYRAKILPLPCLANGLYCEALGSAVHV